MSFSTEAPSEWKNPEPRNPLDDLSRDEILMMHQKIKTDIEALKEKEMEMRKYIVKRAFPNAHEGTNKVDLGNGYQLKAVVKYNYNLAPDNEVVEKGLDKIAALGNEGSFIADRLVSWKPNFLLTEYRELEDNAKKGSKFASDALKIISEFLIITEAAPTVDIVEPKGKKK